ncbi:MAG: type II secretion system F family protein [Burkholderiaceae bacterium]|jgi:hypothetical protein
MIGTTETSWDAMQLALLAAAFLAAALALEGLVLLWHQTRSPTVQRLRRRLQAWVPEAGGPSAAGSHGALSISERGRWPHVLERLQAEAEARWQRRPSRMRQLVSQLPDALDLMSRAMRSGHAFSTAVQMVAEDGPQPLAGEFRRVSEHISLGGDPDEAFDALARRVPVDEMRFFVMAVRMQRQTGGQLGEVLGNIAQLVRQRLQLLDKVRVLTAEGRLSAKILAALPPITAGALLLVRPEFMALLWTDPAGLRLLQASGALMAVGGLWLWRLTRIRV